MDAHPVFGAVAQFVTVIRQCAPPAQTAAVLQNIDAWLPYARGVRIVLDGNILLTPEGCVSLFYLFARAMLDGIAETVRATAQGRDALSRGGWQCATQAGDEKWLRRERRRLPRPQRPEAPEV